MENIKQLQGLSPTDANGQGINHPFTSSRFRTARITLSSTDGPVKIEIPANAVTFGVWTEDYTEELLTVYEDLPDIVEDEITTTVEDEGTTTGEETTTVEDEETTTGEETTTVEDEGTTTEEPGPSLTWNTGVKITAGTYTIGFPCAKKDHFYLSSSGTATQATIYFITL